MLFSLDLSGFGLSLSVRSKCSIFALAICCITIAFASLRAEDGPVVMGIDLSKYPHASHPKDLPDIYEIDPDPAAQGRYRQRKTVYQMPLGESWMTFPVDKDCFYIEPREQGKDFAGRTYGPIPGDPFDKLDLIKVMSERLKADHGNYDDLYRIRLMLRTDEKKLVDRAAKLLAAPLEERAEPYQYESMLGSVEEIVRNNTELFKKHELAKEVESLDARIKEVHEIIESLVKEFPDSAYAPASDSQYAVPKEIPASAWGKPLKGLRAAIVFPKETAKVGEQLDVFLIVENTTDKPIKFSHSDLMQGARAEVLRPAKPGSDEKPEARKIETRPTWFSGLAPLHKTILKAGEQVVIVAPSVRFVPKDKTADSTFGCTVIVTGAGEYDVNYSIPLGTGSSWSRDADGVMRRTSPAKGEWSGNLTTGTAKIEVTE
jgi:hypothetical protein